MLCCSVVWVGLCGGMWVGELSDNECEVHFHCQGGVVDLCGLSTSTKLTN